jgi:hypothetical protein
MIHYSKIKEESMPSINPRINVVCERNLYAAIAEIATRDGASLSSIAHDLLLESLELREDIALAKVADARAEGFNRAAALTADQVFG